MHYAVDVDQTICGSNAHEIYARFHNIDLQLCIDAQILQGLTSYRDFLLLPQVRTFRQEHEKEWNASRHRAIATPSVLEAFLPIEGAAQGVTHLSQSGTVAYYTARTPPVQAATQRWLEQHGFPESQAVHCCSGIEQKLRLLSAYAPQEEPITMIDDRGHTHVLATLAQLQGEACIQQQLLPRLTILAFGLASIETVPGLCPLLALPSWDALQY